MTVSPLQEAVAELQALLKASEDSFFLADASGRLSDYKARVLSDPWRQRESAHMEESGDIFPTEIRQLFRDVVQQVLVTGIPQSREVGLGESFGGRRCSANFLPVSPERVLIRVCELETIPGRRDEWIVLNRLANIGQLTASIAHEINNPLSVVIGFAQSLVRRPGDEEERTLALQSIEREAVRCKQLTQNLLGLCRTERHFQLLDDPTSAFEGAMELIGHEAKLRRIRLVYECQPPLPAIVGDQSQLQQALINLCLNGMDAMPREGTLTVTLARTQRKNQEYLELSVTDTGTGIPPEIREKIFRPFFTTKAPGKGTGLGLGLVREIVQNHQGDLDLHTEVGGGSTFTIRLPAAGDVPTPQRS